MDNNDTQLAISQIRVELRQIISDVTGADLSDVKDDVPLLELITSSLALVEGMRRVNNRFGVTVSLREVIGAQPNLSMLSVYLDQLLRTERKEARPVIEPEVLQRDQRRRQQIPLVPSQQHIGFLMRYSSETSSAYNESLLVRLKGLLDLPTLQAAIDAVGQRHEILHATLSQESNALEIAVDEHIELVTSHGSPDLMNQRLEDMVKRPFEVGTQLFRVELLQLSKTDHVLVLMSHALILDYEALTTILQDIAEFYQAFSRGSTPSTTSSAIQWTEYIEQYAEEIMQRGSVATEEYWKDIFAPTVPLLHLPSDRPRPPVKNYEGARWSVSIEPDLEVQLRTWAEDEGTTLFTVLFSAFTVILHRLAQQKDIVVGTDRGPEYLDDKQRVVARTRNMVPIRSRYDPSQRFADHMRVQADSLVQAYKHNQLSLTDLIQVLKLPRDQSRSALFSAAFRAQEYRVPPAFDSLRVSFMTTPCTGARYDIELILITTESGVQLCCDYSTELFSADTVSRWMSGILQLLRGGIENKNELCGLLPIMLDDERQTLLYEWNATQKPYPRDSTILDLITSQFHTRADHLAIRFRDEELTYAQLEKRVERIAGLLHTSGVESGDRVGILLQRSPDLIASMLAVWRVGAIYVPLDHDFPKNRLTFMLEDAAVQTVITSQALMSMVDSQIGAYLLCIGAENHQTIGAVTETSASTAADSAYIIYTSGSTGQPKGVEIVHSGLTNCLLATQELLGFTADDSLLAITTVSFDISTVELFMPLVAGGVLYLAEGGLIADGIRLAQLIETYKPLYVQATASIWKVVLAAEWGGDKDMSIISAGESLNRELAEQLLVRGRALWNLYGPTETTVHSAAYQVRSAPGKPVCIGRPYPNTQLYILDELAQPVPIGVIGELYIGGDGLARGYWKRPELTQKQFVPNPFRADERLYRTGDLAYYLQTGDVVCLGRIDDQIKVHGIRVELGEIEAALRDVAGIRDAVVTRWTDAYGDTQLVAHVLSTGGITPTSSEIRTQLRERLPEVMIPPYILFSDNFPLTANGKIHRASLPLPNASKRNVTREDSARPATPTERLLADVWSKVLSVEVDRISRDDDFMDLGGHSLLMTPLMVEVRKLFHVSFSMREFFGASSIKKFATLIDERRRARTSEENGNQRAVHLRNLEWGKQRMTFLQREAQLPLNIAPPRGLTFQPVDVPQSVLLTGTTGFLGAYMVAEILRTTDVHLYCLVRPRRGDNGRARIEQQLQKYEVWRDDETWKSAWKQRVHVVEGDVTLPRLGITDSTYEALARNVDYIIHSAAHVNFIYPYEALRATNVLGVHEIIRFAFHSRIKPVHYLSTAAIWPMGAWRTFYEKDSIEHGELLNLGYDEAKWVGERCLLHAMERGLPVARYRPGEVGGDSVTGRCVLEHFVVALVKGFTQFGAFPALDMYLDIAPVDYVAKAVVYMSSGRKSLGRAFHLTNPRCWHMSDALTFLRSLGYRFEELPFEHIRDRLIYSNEFAANALFPYQAAMMDMDSRNLQLPNYDCQETLRDLEGSGIVCPPVDDQLLSTYLRYLRNIGYMPEPV